MRGITVGLAEDHQLVRHGIRLILASEPQINIVGEADDGPSAIELVERTCPRVLILDLLLPKLDGWEVTRRVSRKTHVLVLSMNSDGASVSEALGSGALGYVLKGSSAGELLEGTREVAQGRRFLGSALRERDIDAYQRRLCSADADPFLTLSPREIEVLKLVAGGLSSPAIAHTLAISPRTVDVHRANLMRKLDTTTHAELIRYAIRRGIDKLDS